MLWYIGTPSSGRALTKVVPPPCSAGAALTVRAGHPNQARWLRSAAFYLIPGAVGLDLDPRQCRI